MNIGNPNVASTTNATLGMLDRVPSMSTMMCQTNPDYSPMWAHSQSTSYMLSNSENVKSSPTTPYGTGTQVAAQASMTYQGTSPSFQKLAPKNMSTNPGPMGTDYKS